MLQSLDRLPVNLFHRIFEYFWAHEILYSFLNISDYINDAVLSYNAYSVNFQSIPKSYFDLVCHYILPHQIRSLKLSDHYYTPDQTKIFLSLFSIEQFIRLQAISLFHVDFYSGITFSGLETLEHLVSVDIDGEFPTATVVSILPKLKQLVINHFSRPVLCFEHASYLFPTTLPSMHHLTIKECTCNQLHTILNKLPNLISLNVLLSKLNIYNINVSADNHNKPSFNISSLTLTVGRLVQGYSVHPSSREQLEQFLLHMPCLRRLEVVIAYEGDENLCYADQWETFIMNRLPFLSTFDFKFRLMHMINNTNNVLASFDTSFSFWQSRKRHWFVAIVNNSMNSVVFTVPRFSPQSIGYSHSPVSPPYLKTLPNVRFSMLYKHDLDLHIEKTDALFNFRYTQVERLIIWNTIFDVKMIDFSNVQYLCVQTLECPLNRLFQFIKESMPRLWRLEIYSSELLENSRHAPSIEQIRALELPYFYYPSRREHFDWLHLFSQINRLNISLRNLEQIPILIDRLEHLSIGLFQVVNQKIGVQLPEREWFIRNTRRLKKNNNFTCQICAGHLCNTFWVHMWIGDNASKKKLRTSATDDEYEINNGCSWRIFCAR